MSQQVGIDLNLDANSYTQQAGIALASTTALEQGLTKLAVTAGAANRMWDRVVPSRAHIAGLGAFSAAAVASQSSLSGLAATQAVAGQRSDKLAASIRQMGRDIPIGQRASQQIVETVNQLGVSGAGTERRIASLSKTIAQLQGATGEFGPGLAQGLTQLDRVFGNQNLDPKRLNDTADSLVTVSKKAGVSAGGILDFANAIGPMTKQAGIGESATLGIAAAFGQIGQDGTSAATAVNKMLSDMNRAVRDGSPDMAVYANAVGSTRENFEALFKLDPAKALTQVTKAIGQGGGEGQRVLESLGLDGVRTQRALTALSTSGQLDTQIANAVNARGSGSTSRGASAAWGGVSDQFIKAGNAAGQLAVALGTPMLGPLTLLGKAISNVARPVAAAATSGPGRIGLESLAYGGVGLLAARRLFGIGTGLNIARQLGTSGPIGGFFAGMRSSRGDQVTVDPRTGRPNLGGMFYGRTAGYMQQAYARGDLAAPANPADDHFMRRMNAGAYGAGERLGGWLGRPTTGPSMLRTIAGSGFRGGMWALNAYNTSTQAQAAMAREQDPMARQRLWQNYMARSGIGSNIPAGMSARMQAGQMPTSQDWGQLRQNLRDNAREFGRVTGVARSMSGAFTSTIRGLASTTYGVGRAGIGGAARGLNALVNNTVGWTTLGIMGVTAGVGALSSRMSSRADAARNSANDMIDQGTTGTVDKYLESIGRASTSTNNFSAQLDDTSKAMATSATSMAQALTLSTQDIGQAQATKNSKVSDFGADTSSQQVAAQIRLLTAGNADPSTMQAIKVDLARQYSPDFVKTVLSQVQGQGGGTKAGAYTISQKSGDKAYALAPTGFDAGDIRTTVAGMSGTKVDVGMNTDTNKISASQYYKSDWSALDPTDSNRKSPFQDYQLKKPTRETLNRLAQGVSTNYNNQAGIYSQQYATQERYQAINTAMDTAAKGGNEAVTNELGDRFAKDLMGKGYKVPRITSGDIEKHGGYIQALAAKDKKFGSTLAQQTRGTAQGGEGISLTPGQGVSATAVPNWRVGRLSDAKIDGGYASLFNNTMPQSGKQMQALGPVSSQMAGLGNARGAVGAYMAAPGDPAKQTAAVEGSVTALQGMNHSLGDIVEQASKTAAALGTASDAAYQLAKAQIAEAQFRQGAAAPFQTTSQNIGARLSIASGLMKTPGTDDESKARRQQGREDYAAAEGDLADSLKQRIQMWQQYNIQVQRSGEDYTRQVQRANDSFTRQQGYAYDDYTRQRLWSQEDYQKQSDRANEDFNRGQTRANRDFQITQVRGQQDYFTQRARSIRDFNKQLGREIADQAQALYDPYKRIQTQSRWDAQSLLANMGEQNAAISRQASQLTQLRKMGVSTDAMQQLDLNNPQNAQQLDQLVGDMLNNPNLAKQINATAAQRLSLGKLVVEDPTNKAISRARDDFNTQLSDMETDYGKSMARAKADFNRQMGDQVTDFHTQMSRMAADFQTSLDRSDLQYAISAGRQQTEFNIQLGQMQQDYQTQLGRMKDDIVNASKEITGGVDKLWTTLQDTMKGQNKSANKVMTDGLADTYKIIKSRQGDFTGAYKNLFPYDLSKLFAGGSGGGGGGGGTLNPYFNAAQSNNFYGQHVGGHGSAPVASRVTQGFGESKTGQPETGGGWPVAGTVSQSFGHNGHPGIDLAAPRGTPIHAPLTGIVSFAGWTGASAYGNTVIMDNGGGRSTLYGHMQALAVHGGEEMKPGQLIGWVDDTGYSFGDHLHLETRMNGHLVDPAVYLPQWEATDGLGSFDPGAIAAQYGFTNATPMLDRKTYEDRAKKLGPWGSLLSLKEALEDAAKEVGAQDSNSSSGDPSSGNKGVPHALEQYRPIVRQVLRDLGWPSGESYVMAQMSVEDTSGQLDAVNYNDSNWTKYHTPSVGLMQVIGPTYAGNKPAKDKGPYLWGVSTDPYSNIYAGVHYAMAAYPNDPQHGMAHGHGYRTGGLAMQGPVKGTFGEGGPEALIPLNQSGVRVLADAIGRAVSPDELRGMVTAEKRTHVYHYETHTYDQSTRVEGPITLQSQDPNDMARKLQRKARDTRLVRTGGNR